MENLCDFSIKCQSEAERILAPIRLSWSSRNCLIDYCLARRLSSKSYHDVVYGEWWYPALYYARCRGTEVLKETVTALLVIAGSQSGKMVIDKEMVEWMQSEGG